MYMTSDEVVYHLARVAGHSRYGWIRQGARAIGLQEPYARRMMVHGGGKRMADLMRSVPTQGDCAEWMAVVSVQRPVRRWMMHTRWPRFIMNEDRVQWIDMEPVDTAPWLTEARRRMYPIIYLDTHSAGYYDHTVKDEET